MRKLMLLAGSAALAVTMPALAKEHERGGGHGRGSVAHANHGGNHGRAEGSRRRSVEHHGGNRQGRVHAQRPMNGKERQVERAIAREHNLVRQARLDSRRTQSRGWDDNRRMNWRNVDDSRRWYRHARFEDRRDWNDWSRPRVIRADRFDDNVLFEPSEVNQSFFAGVGVPFCFAQLSSNEVVDRAAINRVAWAATLSRAWSPHVFFFAGNLKDGGKLYARMCAPALGVEEDPATGSACAALVGAVASKPDFGGTAYRLSIQQGVLMGRRSEMEAEARKSGGVVTSVSVGGAVAYLASGEIEVPPSALVS